MLLLMMTLMLMTAQAACVYLPCRHFIHCKECAGSDGHMCDECHQQIEETLNIFQ